MSKKPRVKSKQSDINLKLLTTLSKEPKQTKNYTYLKMIFSGLLVLGVIVFFVVDIRHKNLSSNIHDLADIKRSVAKHILLPTDEEPTLATVTDKKLVKDPFIAQKSENGDQILIYAKNKMVVIYRPNIDKIVAAGDLFADPALTEADGATLTILDGSDNSAKTKAVILKISTLYPRLKVTDGGSSNKKDFPTTVVIDNTNNKDNLVDVIAQNINGKRGIVPISETPTNSDLEIIVGKN